MPLFFVVTLGLRLTRCFWELGIVDGECFGFGGALLSVHMSNAKLAWGQASRLKRLFFSLDSSLHTVHVYPKHWHIQSIAHLRVFLSMYFHLPLKVCFPFGASPGQMYFAVEVASCLGRF